MKDAELSQRKMQRQWRRQDLLRGGELKLCHGGLRGRVQQLLDD